MLRPDELLILLAANCDSSNGASRALLQRLAYLLISALNWPAVGHRHSVHGPMSRALDQQMTRLVADGLVEEHRAETGSRTPSAYRAIHATWRLTAQGRHKADEIRYQRKAEAERLERLLASVMRAAGGLDRAVLTDAARIYGRSVTYGRNSGDAMDLVRRPEGVPPTFEMRAARVDGVLAELEHQR
jgi:hypothetical protein